jgi:glucan 1,3-beta-glucosidase
VQLTNVSVAVGVLNGSVVLPGTSPSAPTKKIAAWVQGNVYHGSDPKSIFMQDNIVAPYKSPSLLTPEGRIVGRVHPQYEDLDVCNFVSVRDFGAVGDGRTDDTLALQTVLNMVCHWLLLG